MDVTEEASIAAAVAYLSNLGGRIDLLVNNAGFAMGGYTEQIPIENWRRQFETNVFGAISVTQAFLPLMRKNGKGIIINMSSVSGRIAFPGFAPYASSKFALEGFSEALRLELLPFGIHVVLVEPGAYRTDIWNKGFSQLEAHTNSPYSSNLEALRIYSQKVAKSASDPTEVAQLIVCIVKQPNPKLRYPIGKGTAFMLFMKSLLPWKWIESLIVKTLQR